MIKTPPEGGEIDKANIRRDFTNELLNFKELKWEKYSSYNPYVLRTLLKWMYFVKGVTPTDEEYVLSLKVPDDSLIGENNLSFTFYFKIESFFVTLFQK